MKKSIILLVVGIAMMLTTSCRWIHETFYSVEGCAEWYAEELYEAAADSDKKDFIERYDQFYNWLDGLSRNDQERAFDALEKWSKKHRVKSDCIDDYADKHNIKDYD